MGQLSLAGGLAADSVRRGNLFGLHLRPMGEHGMVRFFGLELPNTVQVGMVAQCPIGPGAEMDSSRSAWNRRTVNDLRAGR